MLWYKSIQFLILIYEFTSSEMNQIDSGLILSNVTRAIYFVILLTCFLSCRRNKIEKDISSFGPKITEAKGYIVPPVSLNSPVVIPVYKEKLKKIPAGKPMVIPVHREILTAREPEIIVPEKPAMIIPGADTFRLPKKIPVVAKPVAAGKPKAIVAKEMIYKVPNPYSFGVFGRIHGLGHVIVSCLLQDKAGNLWICTAGGVSKYDGRSFTFYSEEEGLCNNDVRSILQDRSGNIWFGTLGGGVSKYDGCTFTNFSEKDGLSNNNVVSIVEDDSGNIWFGTWNGVTKYDGQFFTVYTEKEGLVNNFVHIVLEDKSGNIWVGTNSGLSKFNGAMFSNFTEKQGLKNNDVYCILEDNQGNLWFGTQGGGVFKLNSKIFANFTKRQGLISDEVYSILQDKRGDIWLGTHDGISKYDGQSFANFTEREGLSGNTIYCSLEDNSGNIWFGTATGGVSKFNPSSFNHITEAEGLSKNFVFDLCESRSGDVWIGTWRGGASKYDGKSFQLFTDKQGLANNDVRDICEDKTGHVWFATAGGVTEYDGRFFTHFTEENGLVSNDVSNIIQDKSGNIWFGTIKGASKYDGRTFTNFTKKEGLSGDDIYCIKEDRNGNIWFATTSGLSKFDGQIFTGFTQKEGFGDHPFCSVLEDRSGNIWFGTIGWGALKYDGQFITRFTEEEGLVNNNVASILEDKSGNIWFGTRLGLSKLTPEKLALYSEKVRVKSIGESDIFFKNYTNTDGFLGIGCSSNNILQSRSNSIWIGTNGGITMFNPLLELKDTIPPNIQITGIKLFNEDMDWRKLRQTDNKSFLLHNGIRMKNFNFKGLTKWYNLPENLSLSYNNNFIAFDFAGITMNRPHNVKYQYKLEGLEKNMNTLTDQTSASYGNLPPGNYIFRVSAMNSEGYWSKEALYHFVIRPPWWQTWWFRLVALASVTAIIFYTTRFIYLYKLREQKLVIEKQLAVQYERQRISSDLHDDIGSSLSSINIYSGLAKKEESKEMYLEMISQNVNEVVNKLDDLVWSINPNYDTISSVAERLKVYAEPILRVKEIKMNVCADGMIQKTTSHGEDKHNLYMVLKEIINNAVKHANCKNITLDFSINNRELIITVKDDGQGFDSNTIRTGRNGLGNITQRINNMKGVLEIQSIPGKGTTVIIRVSV